jgi:hypothetical protein
MTQDLQNFLYPRRRYDGSFSLENLAFDANLQEFAQRVNYICNLENGGKMSPHEAYEEIKALWKQLKQSKKQLNINSSNPPDNGNGGQ